MSDITRIELDVHGDTIAVAALRVGLHRARAELTLERGRASTRLDHQDGIALWTPRYAWSSFDASAVKLD